MGGIPSDLVRLVTDLSKTLYLVVQEDGEYGYYEYNVHGVYTDFNMALVTMLEYYGHVEKKNVYDPIAKKWTYHCLMDDFTEFRSYIREIRLDQEQTEKPFIYAFSEIQDSGVTKMKLLKYRYFEGGLPYCYNLFSDRFRTVLSVPLPQVYKTLIKRKEHQGEKKIAEIDVDFVPPNLEQLTAWKNLRSSDSSITPFTMTESQTKKKKIMNWLGSIELNILRAMMISVVYIPSRNINKLECRPLSISSFRNYQDGI